MDAETLRTAAMASKAWPYEEARKLLKRWPDGKPGGAPMIFETGYGPSGLPHIGTFNEVARTTFVRHAYEELTGGAPTRLIAFSDDMDGLRKVPDNVPNQEMLDRQSRQAADQDPRPVRRPTKASRITTMRCCGISSTASASITNSCRRPIATPSGRFDEVIRKVLHGWDAIMGVMLPTLGEDRRKTYSPVLPVSPTSGRVLQVPVEVIDAEAGLIAFDDEDGSRVQQSAFGGLAKLQWKVDWAARWVALGVDYEMAGKDLIDSVTQSGKIARVLGGRPPEGFNYEMFLDEKGEKISKSKGNGLSLEEWLRYGSEPSLAFYIYREPRRAKSLHIGVIPRAVDEYWQFRGNYPAQPIEQKLGNPVHHIHGGKVPASDPAGHLWTIAQPRQPAGDGGQGNGVEVRPALCAGHVAGKRSRARRADRARRQLRARLRRRRVQAPCPERPGSRGAARPRYRACQAPRRCIRRRHPDPGIRGRQAPPFNHCATGSRRSTRRSSALRRARAWAVSSRFTGSTTAAV